LKSLILEKHVLQVPVLLSGCLTSSNLEALILLELNFNDLVIYKI